MNQDPNYSNSNPNPQQGYNNYPGQFPPNQNHAPVRNNTLMIVLIIVGTVIVLFLGAIVVLLASDKSKDKADVQAERIEGASTNDRDGSSTLSDDASYLSQSDALWSPGENYLEGTFQYNGADYGFSLQLNYSGGKITSASYSPHSTWQFSPIRGHVTLSPDGTVLNIDGTTSDGIYTKISASISPGYSYFAGDMTRGDHYGLCTLTFR